MRRRYGHWRLVVHACVAACLTLLVLVRLAQLQVLQGERWQERANDLSQRESRVPAQRGPLLDRNGDPLALSEQRYTVGVSKPSYWRSPGRVERLASWTGLDARSLRDKLQTGRDRHVVIAKRVVLSPALHDSLHRRHGLTLQPAIYREYTLGDLAARVLGRVKASGEGDAGIEQWMEAQLAGTPGRDLVRRAGTLRPTELERVTIEAPIDGAEVILTIDSQMQQLAEAALERGRVRAGAERGMAMVVDPRSMEVLALAEAPALSRRANRDPKEWQSRAAVAAFEPGSTFKLFTTASLLSRGVCDTTTRFDGEALPGERRHRADLGGFSFEDSHPVGVVSLRHAFAVSSNICFGKAAMSLLRDSELESDLRRFGFGQRSPLRWPGEADGLLRDTKSWVERTKPTIAIGQAIGVTMFQMVSAASALLTDGNLRTPRFVLGWRDAQGAWHEPPANVVRERIVSPAVIRQLRGLTREVVARDYGTGHRADIEGIEVGGKTGTAQMPIAGGYDSQRFLASFLATAPASDPRVLILISYEGARGVMRWGGQSAAPVAREILEGILFATHWLDDAATPAPETQVVASMPDLRTAEPAEVERAAAAAGFRYTPAPPSPRARVVGQLPLAGTPLPQGASVQLAWAESR